MKIYTFKTAQGNMDILAESKDEAIKYLKSSCPDLDWISITFKTTIYNEDNTIR